VLRYHRGRQLAEDGYDFVEWAAVQPWSNGKLAFSGKLILTFFVRRILLIYHRKLLSGNLAMVYCCREPTSPGSNCSMGGILRLLSGGIETVSLRDRSDLRLICISGGSAAIDFGEQIIQTFAGKAFVEDLVRMQLTEDLMSPYWEDKIAKLEKINVPAYIVASYTSPIHARGSFEGFRKIASKEKWLRAHNTGEWPDYYDPAHVEDLRKFFDKYLKGIDNGWEKTARVRYAVLDPGGVDTVDREDVTWPVPGTVAKTLYPQAGGALSDAALTVETNTSYEIKQGRGKSVTFSWKVPKTMELIGYPKVKLWVEAVGSNDMELTIAVVKRSVDGKEIGGFSPFPVAAAELIRVSHRALDLNKSTPAEPFLLHTHEELLKPGEIVPIEIALWPIALRYRPGEQLVLSIAPTDMGNGNAQSMFATTVFSIPADGGTYDPATPVPMAQVGGPASSLPGFVRAQGAKAPQSRNKGTHVLHFGGKYDSHLVIPVKMVG
jgi:uncharacterized protein